MRALAFAPLLALAACGSQPDPTDTTFATTEITLPEETAALPATPAGELVTARCTACHSAEMIAQQPAMPAEKWAATVKKMREAYHAPIAPNEDAPLAAALAALQQPR